MKNCLIANLEYCGIAPSNIKHVSLISAKTGFGIEELITKLHNIWEYKGEYKNKIFLNKCKQKNYVSKIGWLQVLKENVIFVIL